jgi:hypothetical protein
VLQFIREQGLVLRSRVLERFSRDPEPVLASVLHDLCDSRGKKGAERECFNRFSRGPSALRTGGAERRRPGLP